LFISGIASADVAGTARVADGDTVKINNTRIRLHGIDALERNQKCEKYGQSYLQNAATRGRPSLLAAYDGLFNEGGP